MARVTVEDCLERIDNRYQLVLTATKRARQIAHGGEPRVDWQNDKPTVVALREIAEGLVDPQQLEQEEAEEQAAAVAEALAEEAPRPGAGESET